MDQHEVTQPPSSQSVLHVAYETGMMPAKWFGRWRDRHLAAELVDVVVPPGQWQQHLGAGQDVVLVRLPAHPQRGSQDIEGLRGRYRVVPAYQERQVVVLPADHELTLLEQVSVADIADEYVVHELTDLPEYRASLQGAGTDDDGQPVPALVGGVEYEQSIEYVAAGVGIAVVPMSIARFYHRKDLTYRPVADLPGLDVVVVWPQDLDDVTEDLIQDFVGVVRGRTKGSSRGGASHRMQVAPSTPRGASRAVRGSKTSSSKPGERPTKTAKGTTRGEQLSGKRLAGGAARRGRSAAKRNRSKPSR